MECVWPAEESVDAEEARSGELNLVTRPHNEELCVKGAPGALQFTDGTRLPLCPFS